MGKLSVDKDLIRELAELLNETGLTEIEVENDDNRIRVSRSSGGAVQVSAPAAPVPAAAPTAPEDKGADLAGAVTSPMVGTAYLSPEPGAKPFVSVGDMVKEGQTLMIVEAMKTMNPITAPRAGKVAQVLVSDGDPVEYGQPLVVLE